MNKTQYYATREAFTSALNHFTLNDSKFEVVKYDFEEKTGLYVINFWEHVDHSDDDYNSSDD